MSNEDLYSFLGVPPTATLAQIKERFKFLSHAYHPDKFATESQRRTAEQEFKRINLVYQILSDPEQRARYDSQRAHSTTPPSQDNASPSQAQASNQSGRGRFLMISFATFIGVLGIIVFYQNDQNGKRMKAESEALKIAQNAEDAAEKSRILPREIELVDLTLKPAYGTGEFTLAGRIRNNSSRYTITLVHLQLTMRDSLPSGGSDLLGQAIVNLSFDVPPGQARDFADHRVSFPHVGEHGGKHQWDYVVEYIRAK